MTDGKLKNVLIEDKYHTDERTGVRELSSSVTVWADAGKVGVIKSVAGVVSVYIYDDVRYVVHLDPRYDREYVKRDIELAINLEG